jgi:hypothetical protein
MLLELSQYLQKTMKRISTHANCDTENSRMVQGCSGQHAELASELPTEISGIVGADGFFLR